jgi:Holliday junction DNA helicase RuvA
MIAFVKGTLIEKTELEVVVEANGIGYSLLVSTNTLSTLPAINSAVQIFTYTHVREDEISLFGFSSPDEKAMFMKLISVNGIGPKSALVILSGMSLQDLMNAIATENLSLLQKIKGLGKKTSERLVLELKDKISTVELVQISEKLNQSALTEAVEVLVSLGISKNQALLSGREFANENATTEEIIQNVLQNMGR